MTNDKKLIAGKLKEISDDIAELLAMLEGPEEGDDENAPPSQPAKEMTLEETRKILAEKARNGYRAEVRAILAAHGAKQLSDITDPAVFAAIVAEAEVIGSA